MKKILIIFTIFLFSSLGYTQVNGACTWTGADNANNTNWTNTGNWTCSGSPGYPSGSSAVVTISGGSSTTITLDADITLKQFKHGGSTGGSWTLDQASGGSNTLTLQGTGTTQVWQHNRGNVQWTINANMTLDAASTGTKQFKLGTSSHANSSITFSSSSTLTLSDDTSLKFIFDKDGHSLTFNGTITSGDNDRDLIFADLHTVTFGSTVSMSNMGGDLLFYGAADDNSDYTGGTATTGGITVNGDVSARQIKLSASSLTVNVTGSLTSTGTAAAKNMASDGSGKFILKTSKSNSGSIINKLDTDGYNLDFVRTVDGDSEWTLVGVPVTGESVQDVIDNNSLRTGTVSGSSKSAIGIHDNASNTYSYYDPSGNSATLTNGQGYLISASGSGTQDVTFSGTAVTTGTSVTFTATNAGTSWNFVGNPYPSYLALNGNVTGHSGTDANFISKNDGPLHNTYTYVYAWNGSSWDLYGASEPTVKYIAPGEGFFINMRSGTPNTGTLYFHEDMQLSGSHRNFNSPVASGYSENISRINIKIEDLDSAESDNIKLFFSDKTTKGLDPGYDGGKFFTKNSAYIYTRLLENDEGIDLWEQSLPYSDLRNITIPIGIETKSSQIELSFIERDINEIYNVFLEDKLTNRIVKFDKKIKIDLFDELNGLGRFYLHFTDQLIPELPTDNNLRIFKNTNSELTIMGNSDERYKAKIYDYSGRLIKEIDFRHKANINDLDSKMKILRIESKEGLTIKKFKLN